MIPASVDDYRALARRRLPQMLFDYVDGGSFDEAVLRSNRDDFGRVLLRQRVMTDTSAIDLEVATLGTRLSMPLGLAPVGIAGMCARRGEAQAARAAKVARVPMCLSTLSLCSIEEVAAAGEPPWFQLYMLKDRGYARELLARAEEARCPVLVFTVDMPTPGARYRDYRRSGIAAPPGIATAIERLRQGMLRPRWSWDVFARGGPHLPGNIAAALADDATPSDALAWVAANLDRTVTWADLDFVRAHWPGPLVIKGVFDPEDARAAVAAGADGVIVSNHGGRQLDGVRSSIAALPRVADAVGGETEIFLDGGVRSGVDVLKALALGARACFVGRPWAWALAAGGEAMVERLLGTLRSEIATAMILAGLTGASRAGPAQIDANRLVEGRFEG